MDILEQVGITKDELIDRIVDKALGITADFRQTGEESWDNIPLSSVVDKKISDAIGNLIESMKTSIKSRIDRIMSDEIENVFTMPFQPVNQWGEKQGEITTIKDIIAKEAQTYWTTKVDQNGNAGDSYGKKEERSIFYARRVMSEYYDQELAKTVRKMAEELKAMIPATIGEEITKAVVSHLR